jgi:hypothetical protein
MGNVYVTVFVNPDLSSFVNAAARENYRNEEVNAQSEQAQEIESDHEQEIESDPEPEHDVESD